ncbi:glutathione S-transferase family protein [Pseudooceanicola batsensis HTCC2597]|uniref:Glutathione S-transferase family protein n=1 Tax=Pseudooceanicola batsensis (strain ATCC BAA-863 / DSM 15984 / KCTC 12145 / HTCC2597) TaxID=252305 RepID=A3TW94_PSEBH|nr:glutathione S-transferase family protein [Pseudooceanicola batsensis]EAQ03890.1 glutathione S-transferase family protein [Pseudooceanicola batsensis HTCC2597]
MYTVIGASRNRTFRVIWMLEELGEPYERVRAKQHTPEILQHSRLGKMPVLLDQGEAITDSAAILTYLADRHGKMTAEAGTIARAKQDALTFHVLDDLESIIWTATRHGFILPEERRVAGVKDTAKWEWARNAKAVAERFRGPFVMGDEMTVPDILLTHTLTWGMGAKFAVESEALQDYVKRMQARPAFQRAVESEKEAA